MTDIKPPTSGASLAEMLRNSTTLAGLPEMPVEKEARGPREWQGPHSGVAFRCEWDEGFPTLSMTIDGPLPAIISYTCESEEVLQLQADIFDFGFEIARDTSSFDDKVIRENSLSLIFFRNYIRHTAMSLHSQIESRATKVEVNQENLRMLERNRKSAKTIMAVAERVDRRLREALDPYVLAQIENVNSQTEH